MGFELLKVFQVESRRFMWVIGLVFATILLFQGIELPKGNALWSMIFQGEDPKQNVPSSLGENFTSDPVMLRNLSSPSSVNTSVINDQKNSSVRVDDEGRNGTLILENLAPSLVMENNSTESSSSNTEAQKEDSFAFPPEQSEDFDLAWIAPSPLVSLHDNVVPNTNMESSTTSSPNVSIAPSPIVPSHDNVITPNTSVESSTTSSPNITMESSTTRSTDTDFPPPPPPIVYVSPKKQKSAMPEKEVYTLTDMNDLLTESYLSPSTMVPRWSSKADKDLILAKQLIENAPPLKDDALNAPLYRNASMFQRSYDLMEQMLKVYIYKEGDRRIFHHPPLEGIYASEGWFMKQMEADRHFVTKRPNEAHLFYLPFSSRQLEETLYVPNSHNHKNLVQHLKDYVDMIAAKYPFWNRTDGADHFLVACHDWASSETKRIMSTCIRALCNADVKEKFKFGKDVSLPETYVRKARNPLRDVGGKRLSKRKTLAFYAGNMHGYLRPILLEYWGNKNDPDMQIFGRLPQSKDNRNYINYMKSSKFCICPKGYEVNSPRVVEAIFYECVPVIISDNFVPPFFETLNWESFAVFVAEKDIPNLKNILLSIPDKTYMRMQMRVRRVQRHFLWHHEPVKYDLYHMILHSIWFNRVFQFRPL